ncbi:hypothetical protein BEI46_18470 [Aliivibrio fischeri]|uniref:hypothetical protein n=1 Tax=Aliivibrio fischeri TaxID=668 RepID=UPI00084C55D9|nr:hypothetical protein [Aliivibrio fischeri]OED52179.1 hypothetical protein BEI46_18470 [Aliivibrio fischeri]
MSKEFFDFFVNYDLLAPTAQIIAALIALFAVLISQYCIYRTTNKTIDAKFEVLKKEHQNEFLLTTRREKLDKIEEIFELILHIRREYSTDNFHYINEIGLTSAVDLAMSVLKNTIERKMRLKLLVSIYVPKLNDSLELFESEESNLSRHCYSYKYLDQNMSVKMFIEYNSRVLSSLNEFQNSLLSFSEVQA